MLGKKYANSLNKGEEDCYFVNQRAGGAQYAHVTACEKHYMELGRDAMNIPIGQVSNYYICRLFGSAEYKTISYN